MATQKSFVGSRGPYEYSDLDRYVDSGGLVEGFRTSGQMLVETAPTLADHVVRKSDLDTAVGDVSVSEGLTVSVADIDDPASEMSTLSADGVGKLIVAYEAQGASNFFTLYAWDASHSVGPNSPYIVQGDGGYWIAVGGLYKEGNLSMVGNLTVSGSAEFNQLGGDSDFRVHGENINDCIKVDASADIVEMYGEVKIFNGLQVNPGPAGDFDFRVDGSVQTGLILVDGGLNKVSVGGEVLPNGLFNVRGNMAIGANWSASDQGITVPTSGLAVQGKVYVGGAAEFNALGADNDFRVHGENLNDSLWVDASDDAVHLGTGGGSAYTHGFLHINADTGDFDTRIDGDTQTALFFVNAGTDRVSVGGELAPRTTFSVKGSVAIGSVYAGNTGTVNVPASGIAVEGKIYIAAGSDSPTAAGLLRLGSGDDSEEIGDIGNGLVMNAQGTNAHLLFQVDSSAAASQCGIRWDDIDSSGDSDKKWGLYMDTGSGSTGQLDLRFLDGSNNIGVTWSQLLGFTHIARAHIFAQTAQSSSQPVVKITSDLTVDSRNEVYHDYAATTDATVTTVRTLGTVAGDRVKVSVEALGADSTGAKYVAHHIVGYFENTGGTLAQLGSTYNIHTALESDAAYAVDFNVSSQNIQVRVTGKAGDSLVWHIYTDLKEFG